MRGPDWVPRYLWERLVLGVVLLTVVGIGWAVVTVVRWFSP